MSALEKALLLAKRRVNNLAVTGHSVKNPFLLPSRNIKTFWGFRVLGGFFWSYFKDERKSAFHFLNKVWKVILERERKTFFRCLWKQAEVKKIRISRQKNLKKNSLGNCISPFLKCQSHSINKSLSCFSTYWHLDMCRIKIQFSFTFVFILRPFTVCTVFSLEMFSKILHNTFKVNTIIVL